VSKLLIEERHVDDVTLLVLTGQMLLDDGDLAFKRQVDALLGSGRLKILLDLDGVDYIDSSGVGMMVAQLKAVQRGGGDIRLLRLNSRGQRLFSLLKLRSWFETFEDEALAVRASRNVLERSSDQNIHSALMRASLPVRIEFGCSHGPPGVKLLL
jgi:anti-sigma B factor antagonist